MSERARPGVLDYGIDAPKCIRSCGVGARWIEDDTGRRERLSPGRIWRLIRFRPRRMEIEFR